MAQSLIFTATDGSGNKTQKAVTNINPAKTDYELKTFAQSVNALTGNTFVSANRVERTDITNATDGNNGGNG